MTRSLSRFEIAWRESRGVPAIDPSDDAADMVLEPAAATCEPAPSDVAPPAVAPSQAEAVLEFKGSSNVRAARFDAATGVVDVEFKSGKVYRYANFTTEMMAAWRDAPSAGSWFDAIVKKQPDRHPLVPAAPGQ